MIPPQALFERINPAINTKFLRVKIPTECIPWPTSGLRRISVNSFGFGGSNSHIILDDAFHSLKALGAKANHCTTVFDKDEHTAIYIDPIEEGRTQANGVRINGHPREANGDHVNRLSHELNGARNDTINKSSETNGKPERPKTNGHLSQEEIADLKKKQKAVLINGTARPKSSQHHLTRHLLVWSARDEAALRRMLSAYDIYYQTLQKDSKEVERLALTLSERRSVMRWRSFAVVDSGTNASPGLPLNDGQRSLAQPTSSFIFTGQGAQYFNMGMELLAYSVFHDTIKRAGEVFRELGAQWDMFDALQDKDNVNSPEFSQPLCTVVQIALVELLRSFGIVPVAVVGHSSGEIAAAYTVGALSLHSACKVAFYRGILAKKASKSANMPSAMISMNMSEREAEEYLRRATNTGGQIENLHVACINSPNNVTLSGSESSIDMIKLHCDSAGIFSQKLKTGVAYHSPFMEAVSSEYLEAMGEDLLEPSNAYGSQILMVSSVTGSGISVMTLRQPSYWVENLVSPVRFLGALQYLAHAAPKAELGNPVTDVIEVGPHGALRRSVKDSMSNVRYSSVLSRFESNLKTTMEAAGRLWTLGFPVSISTVNQVKTETGSLQFISHTPEYPFDTTQTHWHEPRFSRDYRLREAVPEPVLGARAYDWNPLEPKWRKMLSLEDIPWTADHVVGDTALYPGAGTLMMALEAVKQHVLANPTTSEPISGYLVKDAEFTSPIIIRPGIEGRAEVLVSLRPLRSSYEKVSTRFEVRIAAHTNAKWSDCFRASIHVEHEEVSTQVDNGFESNETAASCLEKWKRGKATCNEKIEKKKLYEYMSDHGVTYGESFALLDEIFWDGRETTIACVPVESSTQQYAGLVHPAVLDTAFQMCVTAPSEGLKRYMHAMVPQKISDMWLSATGWQHPETAKVRMMATSSLKPGRSGLQCSIAALADNDKPLCYAERLEMASMLSTNSSAKSEEKKLLYNVEWKPHLSLLTNQQLRSLCEADHFPDNEAAMEAYGAELELTLRAVISETLQALHDFDVAGAPFHIQKYVAWMQRHSQPGKRHLAFESLDKQIDHVEKMRPSWKLYTALARDLAAVIRGEIDALEIMFSSPLAETFYADIFNNICDHKFAAFFSLASHQNPSQRILEVGAGTGGMTYHILSALDRLEEQTGGQAFAEYVYTDISAAFFEKAKERFSNFADRMTFRPLDLENDVVKQGFDASGYDIVFAGSVLHATSDIANTLTNIRSVLKPGGKLVFLEITGEPMVVTFAFGLLPGWWLSKESYREWNPTLTVERWGDMLLQTGFSGNDLVLRDYQSEASHFVSIVVSTAIDEAPIANRCPRIIFVVAEESQHQVEMAKSICIALFYAIEQAVFVTLAQLSDLTPAQGEPVVFLVELEQPFLHTITQSAFQKLQRTVQKWSKLLWVSAATLCDPSYAFSGIKDGLLRSLRSESITRKLISMTIEDPIQNTGIVIDQIAHVFSAAFHEDTPEVEYVVRNGHINTGRLLSEHALNFDLRSSVVPVTVKESWLPGPPLKFAVGTPGALDTLQFVEDHEALEELGPDEVEIRAEAWGIAFRDVFIALGRLEEDDFGADCAGVLTRIGTEVTSVKPGDRALMNAMGCLKMFPRSKQWGVAKIPDSLSFEEATAMVGPSATVYYSLIEVGRLQKGDKILIHAASGGIGQIAIMVAQMLGAEVFATVGYDVKKKLLMDEFGIPADHIFYSRNTSFAKGIKRITNGYGVDVVLNSLAGESLRASWECVAPYGRFIELGKADINANSALPMSCFAKNVSFSAIDLRHVGSHRLDISRRLLDKAMEMVNNGKVRPQKPLHVFPVSEIENAFRYMQSGKNSGRIVVRVLPDAPVTKTLLKRHDWTFDSGFSYVVVGGFGGIGRALLKWMAGRDARNIIVLSRSGVSSTTATEVVQELERDGIKVATIKCDASSMASLATALIECARTMPAIRGAINAAMVLQDSILENMSYKQWDLTVRTKIQSSWNLHQLLPPDVDFFVQLSSLAGIYGNAGQSNYAAGCTFQDALARHRIANGQNAVSLDLGWMSSIGIIAETEEYQKNREVQADMGRIETAEFCSLMNMYCDPHRSKSSRSKSQILVGALTPADLLAQNLEPPEVLMRPLFSSFSQARDVVQSSSSADSINYAVLFRQTELIEERAQVVVDALAHKLARALSISAEDVDVDKHLPAFGVDSLVAVELRNWIGKDFGADVAVFDLMGSTTVRDIGKLVASKATITKSG